MDGQTATCAVCRTRLVFVYIDAKDSLDGKVIYEPEDGLWVHSELTLRETAGHAAQPIGDTIAASRIQDRRA
jgi:hypothetical protein